MKRHLTSIRLICCLALSLAVAFENSAHAQGAGTATRSTTTYPSSTEMGEATFSVDPETRRLIVVTDEETAQSVEQVIKTVDRPAPQVLIKVVFVEVTYRDGLDFGIEGNYTRDAGGDRTFTASQAFNGVAGLTSGSGLYSLLASDYQVTLRAIAESGKMEVLSRPTILARNNQQATITVGQRVPLITNTRFDNFGNQINSISYQDVGIILAVTPFITTDNMVEMIVSPEISSLSEQTVSISSSTNSTIGAPVINVRQADTVVVTPDGQTIVIGGLMENKKSLTESKIPLLGDIPLLGNLFKRKVKNDTKTELLIFLTPQIVKTPDELAHVTSGEAANTQIVPKAFKQEQLDRYFDNVQQ